jgi:hypothetical protein
MRAIKSMNQLAFLICFLFYLTCYLRFIGQSFLAIVQIISAIFITIEIYSKSINPFKKRILLFWKMAGINIIIVTCFYTYIMNNDFLQFPFISIFPNLIALYFWNLLNNFIDITTLKNNPHEL